MKTRPMDLFQALRPKQWTKNAVVFAPFVFALGDVNQDVTASLLGTVVLAAVSFCLVSSGIYLVNDLRDRDQDRAHPQKRNRPIAAGRIQPATAVVAAMLLILAGFALGYGVSPQPPELLGVLVVYVVLQLAYTFFLKRLAMIDVLVIASGFVLRAIAGAVVIHVEVSPWLLVCAFLLAMFLALCKRRQEFVARSDADEPRTRESLDQYNERLLDQMIAIAASSTVVCYAIYTLAPTTVEKFGTTQLGFTLPFVIFGLFRYLHLVYRCDLGERPEQVLLTDIPLLLNLGVYGLSVMVVLL